MKKILNIYMLLGTLLLISCNEEVQIPDAPYGLQIQYFCKSDFPGPKDIEAQGENITWYDSEDSQEPIDILSSLEDGKAYFASQTIDGIESKARFRVVVSITDLPAPNGVTQYEVINIGHIKTYLKDLEISGSNVIWFEQSQLSLLDSMSEIASSGDYYLASIDGNCRSLDLTKVSVAVNSNLLLFYDMNDNCQDLSSNVFDGVFNGSYAPGIDGLGNAATFNGVDQYIELPNDLALKPDFPMSFSYWIKFDDLNVNNAVVFTTDYVENSHTGVWMTLSSVGELSVNIGNGTGTTSVSRKTFIVNTPININTWYHVGAVLESIDSFKIYMNGVLQDGNYAGSASSLVYTEFPGSIGRKDGSTLADPYYFKGQLDDFSYWGRVLSETEINKLMGN